MSSEYKSVIRRVYANFSALNLDLTASQKVLDLCSSMVCSYHQQVGQLEVRADLVPLHRFDHISFFRSMSLFLSFIPPRQSTTAPHHLPHRLISSCVINYHLDPTSTIDIQTRRPLLPPYVTSTVSRSMVELYESKCRPIRPITPEVDQEEVELLVDLEEEEEEEWVEEEEDLLSREDQEEGKDHHHHLRSVRPLQGQGMVVLLHLV